MPFPPWLYLHVINHWFIVIYYKSLPGSGDGILERKQKHSKWLFILVPSVTGAEGLGDGHGEERQLSLHSISCSIFAILYNMLVSLIQKYKLMHFLKPLHTPGAEGTQCIKPVY